MKSVNGTTQTNSPIILPAVTTAGIFLIKYNSSGIAQWGTYLDGLSPGDTGQALAIDSSGNVYITGGYTTSSLIIYNATTSATPPTVSPVSLPSANAAYLIKYNPSTLGYTYC